MALVFRSHIIHTFSPSITIHILSKKIIFHFRWQLQKCNRICYWRARAQRMVRFSKYAFKISIYFGLKYPYPYLILIFLASTSEILGGPDIYKQFGDMINLTCVIKGTAAPPETIYWYHRGKVRYRNHLYSNTYNLCTNYI